MPARPRSVHLKLDPDVFEFFWQEAQGKGHITRMQNVLRAYVRAHRPP
ncbi:MAG: BrnA antitoxin family protein [Bauldia sp.]